jgi:hypothetical protein
MLFARQGSWRASWFGVLVLVAGVLLIIWADQRKTRPASPIVPLDDWDIPQRVAFLNDEGMALRLVDTGNAPVGSNAYLTTTNKGWDELNALVKHPDGIEQWQGILYCENAQGLQATWPGLIQQWGDCCLVVGPFLFFGDRQLLGRVRAALTGTRRQTALPIKPKPPHCPGARSARRGHWLSHCIADRLL